MIFFSPEVAYEEMMAWHPQTLPCRDANPFELLR